MCFNDVDLCLLVYLLWENRATVKFTVCLTQDMCMLFSEVSHFAFRNLWESGENGVQWCEMMAKIVFW